MFGLRADLMTRSTLLPDAVAKRRWSLVNWKIVGAWSNSTSRSRSLSADSPPLAYEPKTLRLLTP